MKIPEAPTGGESENSVAWEASTGGKVKEAPIGRIPGGGGKSWPWTGLRMAAKLFEIEMQRTPMIHLSKMCIRTGFVSCAKFFCCP